MADKRNIGAIRCLIQSQFSQGGDFTIEILCISPEARATIFQSDLDVGKLLNEETAHTAQGANSSGCSWSHLLLDTF